MIEGFHQRHYKNAIINILEDWGGEAYGYDVIDALMNDPKFQIELTPEEKAQRDPCGDNTFKHACRAAAEQLRKNGYIEKVKPTRTMIKRLFTDLTPFIPLSLKGEGEGIIFEGASPLQSTLNEQSE